jgi:PEGA domain
MKAFLTFRRAVASTMLPAMVGCVAVLFISVAPGGQSSADSSAHSSTAPATGTGQAKSDGSATPAATAQDPAKPQHLAAPLGRPSELVNRQALERNAGKNPCKLLLRSTPAAAQVFVDGAFVGNSPVELVVAPGKYQIEMKGQRMDSAQRAVDLLPRETREVALSLTARYPTHVTAQ